MEQLGQRVFLSLFCKFIIADEARAKDCHIGQTGLGNNNLMGPDHTSSGNSGKSAVYCAIECRECLLVDFSWSSHLSFQSSRMRLASF